MDQTSANWLAYIFAVRVRLDNRLGPVITNIMSNTYPPITTLQSGVQMPSVVQGGHFYSYNSLHLTEISRAIDKLTDDALLNQSHPSVAMTLSLMLAALPLLNNYRKNLLLHIENNYKNFLFRNSEKGIISSM
jgi:hypothetical protein